MDRRLSAEERALWHRLAATVTPIAGKTAVAMPRIVAPVPIARNMGQGQATIVAPSATAPARPVAVPSDTLDGGWDRRLRRGMVVPDRSIDLHGHTLVTAQSALEAALADAVASGHRVLLVVTGKPPRGSGESRRGLIRASIFDWLARSRQGDRIAAVRNAHPRHGGAGALYLILRRTRAG